MDNGTLALFIPILAVGGPFLFLIVRTMSKHQLAVIELQQRNVQAVDPRVDLLQREIAEMKDLLHQQTIALDNLSRPVPAEDVRQRVGG